LSDIPETGAEQQAAPLETTQEDGAQQHAVTEAAETAATPAADEFAPDEFVTDEPVAEDIEAEDIAAEADGFAALGLSDPILQALHDKGYLRPTPIQAQAIPTVLMGRDVLGCAQTGTGKTAGFTLPLLDILSGSRARARMPRSLILEPTRELALQVAENFVAYGKYLKLNHALLIGGESMADQKDALTKGVDVLIATPGRLIDLFERGGLLLTDVRVLVIDEADRMLDMGFIPDIERIVAMLPRTRQTLFFSATMAPEIRRLADAFLNNPKEITVSKPASVATTITAGLVLVNEHDKREALRRLIRSEDVQNALIFCNRKRDVDILLKSLLKHNFSAGALHGDLAQSVRFATLEKFKAGDLRLLVCSDVAARGIDIGGLSHVFNFDVPHHSEDYVHRIGRTGRAGKEGRAFTIATPDDRLAVEAVEKLIAAPIPRIEIPGLDVVEWAEGDARRGRGRGKGKPPAKTSSRPAKTKEAAEPRERTPRPPRAEPRRESHPEPREPRTVYADHGPNVRGFGADIPAFMLIRKRGPLSAILEQPSETEEADVINEPNGNEDMAA
jgi:superfamily II DNA/RNA helicase